MLYLKSNSLNAMGIVVYANSKAADNICVDDELIVYGTVKRFERSVIPVTLTAICIIHQAVIRTNATLII